MLSLEFIDPSHAHPVLAAERFKRLPERRSLALMLDVMLQHGELQVVAVKAQMVVEHLSKDAQNSRLVLVDGAFHINVEQNRLRLAAGGFVNHHEGGGIIGELLPEALDGSDSLNFPVLQNVGQHLQEVGFTAAKEAGNPYAGIRSRCIKGVAVIAEEGHEVLFQFIGDDVFVQLLFDDIIVGLLHLDHAVDFTVNIIGEHVVNPHNPSPLR